MLRASNWLESIYEIGCGRNARVDRDSTDILLHQPVRRVGAYSCFCCTDCPEFAENSAKEKHLNLI